MPSSVRTMRRSVKRVSIVAKRHKPEAVAAAAELLDILAKERISAEVEPHLAEQLTGLPSPLNDYDVRSDGDSPIDADLVVVLGGDGTLIHATSLLRGRGSPVLGINLGTLGFLTEFPRERLGDVMQQALHGKLRIEERALLRASLLRGRRRLASRLVVNDVVMNKSTLARIAVYETRIDGDLVTNYRADGVIVATPTGSTAYALSAGGPIVFPTLDTIIIAPICPHRLTHRPIVVPADRRVELTVRNHDSEVYLTLDGQQGMPIEEGDRLVVSRASDVLRLVTPPDRNYFDVLRSKLNWGELR